MIRNALSTKSSNPKSLKKIIITAGRAFQLMCTYLARICWKRSTSYFVYGVVIQVIGEKTLCGKDFTRSLRNILIRR